MIILSRPDIGPEEVQAVTEVLESGMLASGARVAKFEEAFASAIGAKHAVAVGSGTASLHLGLIAMGVGEGDEVIVPSFTFAASANAIRFAGAVPVFADIDPSDYTIHASHIEPLLTSKTRAVMPVHLYGQTSPMREIEDLAVRAGIDILEDAAQAHLAKSSGRFAGSIGRAAGFSFYPTKNMTTGEGGMITTFDSDVAEKARWLRNQGMVERYEHRIVGLNERMTEIEAAIGLIQLQRLPEWNKRRRQIADIYKAELHPSLGLPIERDDAIHVFHQFTIAPPDREKVRDTLRRAGIGHDVYYPKAAHQQDPYVGPAYDLPVTELLVQKVLSIPVRPGLAEGEIGYIIETLNGTVD